MHDFDFEEQALTHAYAQAQQMLTDTRTLDETYA